jgi:tRNA(Ile2) C34 agmatinyltransferase TiaS
MPMLFGEEPVTDKLCRRCGATFRSKCRIVRRCPACREANKIEQRIPWPERKRRKALLMGVK